MGNRPNKRTALRSAILAAAALAGAAAAWAASPNAAGSAFEPRPGATLRAERLRAETGAPAALSGEGRPTVLVPAYYKCPTLCTLVIRGVARASRGTGLAPGRDFDVKVLSFDARETPADAAAKREDLLKNHVLSGEEAAGWSFLTGPSGEVRQALDAAGFRYEFDEASGEFAHPAAIAVLTPEGRVSSYLTGWDFSPKELKGALVEAAHGRIGGWIERFVFLCRKLDPTSTATGRATLAWTRILAAVTALALGAFVARSLWRERKGA